MGAGQSGPHVITVQTGEGETDITVSQEFVDHVMNETDTEDNEYSTNQPPRAQDVLSGSPTFSNNIEKLYEEEKIKNAQFKNITDKEFEEAAINVKNQFIKSNVACLVPACEDVQKKVMECYHSNSKRTLKCSREVQEYTKCVQNVQKGLLVQTLPMSETTD